MPGPPQDVAIAAPVPTQMFGTPVFGAATGLAAEMPALYQQHTGYPHILPPVGTVTHNLVNLIESMGVGEPGPQPPWWARVWKRISFGPNPPAFPGGFVRSLRPPTYTGGATPQPY